MSECIERIREYTAGDRSRFEASRLVQDAVVRNLQTLTESSQRLSDDIKTTEPQVPWRELAGAEREPKESIVELSTVVIDKPADVNFILGQSHWRSAAGIASSSS
jgi:hypothetical protein